MGGQVAGEPVRSFQFDEVVAVSGLSRAQVDRLVATAGFPVYGPGTEDRAHPFLAPDLFNFSLAAALLKMGLSVPAIRDVVAGLGSCERSPSSNLPIELFPGQRREKFGPSLFVVRVAEDGARATLVTPGELWAGVAAYGAHAAIVIDATGLAERIAASVP